MAEPKSGKHLSLLEAINSDGENRDARPKVGSTGAEARERPAMAYSESGVVGRREEPPAARLNPTEARAAPDGPMSRADAAEADAETNPDMVMPDLPRRTQKRRWGGIVSFIFCVALPTLIAAVYYYGYATDQYVANFNFTVRDISTTTSTSSASDSLTAMVGISGKSSSFENYMVVEYMTSRQAVEDLQKKIDIVSIYSKPFADFWARLNPNSSLEYIARYWKNMARVEYDTIQGTSAAEVRAFTPEDALLVAQTLLSLGEDLINDAIQRPQREAIQYAQAEVKIAEDRLKTVMAELSNFRNVHGVIDPMTNIVNSNSAVAATLRSTMSTIQTEVTALKKQGLHQNSQPMQNLQIRLKATEDQLKEIEAQVSKTKQSGDTSISTIVGLYEQLELERLFAQNMLTATMQSLEQARANASAKRLYVTAFVKPVEPQISTYPRRFIATLTVLGASLLLWTISLLFARSIGEHLT